MDLIFIIAQTTPTRGMVSKQIVLSVGGRDLRRKELVEERIELLVVVKRHSSVRALYPTHLGGLRAAVARVPCDHERQPLSVGDRLMLVRVRPPPIAAHPTATEVAYADSAPGKDSHLEGSSICIAPFTSSPTGTICSGTNLHSGSNLHVRT